MQKQEMKAFRQATGLTQQELAREIGCSIKLIQGCEQGRRRITKRTAKAIMLLLPRLDNKKGLAPAKPLCPFCGNKFEIET